MVARAVGVDPAVAAVDAPGSAGATAVGVRLVVVMQAIKTVGHAYVVDWVTLVAGTIAVHVARKVGPTLKRTVQSAVHEWFGAILDAIATAWRLALRACADAALAIGGLRTVAAVGTWIGANGSAVDVSFTAVGDAILTGWRGARSTLTGGVDAVAMSPTAVTVGAQVWASRTAVHVAFEAIVNPVAAGRFADRGHARAPDAVAMLKTPATRGAAGGAATATVDVALVAIVDGISAAGCLAHVGLAHAAGTVRGKHAVAPIDARLAGDATTIDVAFVPVEQRVVAGGRGNALAGDTV